MVVKGEIAVPAGETEIAAASVSGVGEVTQVTLERCTGEDRRRIALLWLNADEALGLAAQLIAAVRASG